MYRSILLLQTLLAVLAARGLHAEALDPWRGWIAFKHYVRVVDELPDPGISVQLTDGPDDDSFSLVFLRQVLKQEEGDWLRPVGGVICEFSFLRDARRPVRKWDYWSMDFHTLERFIDHVEQDPAFAALMTRIPRTNSVYWQEA